MTDDRSNHSTAARPLDLAGDSPELVALALLRHLAQLEEGSVVFDRAWMLDAYAECLEAVHGKRRRRRPAAPKAAPAPVPGGKRRR